MHLQEHRFVEIRFVECFQKPVITGHVATEDLTCVVSNFEPLRALHVFTKPCARYEEQQMLQAVTKNDFCERNKIQCIINYLIVWVRTLLLTSQPDNLFSNLMVIFIFVQI